MSTRPAKHHLKFRCQSTKIVTSTCFLEAFAEKLGRGRRSFGENEQVGRLVLVLKEVEVKLRDEVNGGEAVAIVSVSRPVFFFLCPIHYASFLSFFFRFSLL